MAKGLPDLFFIGRFGRQVRDEASAAFEGEIGVSPLQQHGKFVAKTDQKK